MKNYPSIIILSVLLLGGSIFYFKNRTDLEIGLKKVLVDLEIMTVCDQTLYYSLGRLDDGFEVSREDALFALEQAETVWEKDLNKNLFEYKEDADFKINFIFDERQIRTKEKEQLDQQLAELAYDKDNLSAEYQDKYNVYNQALHGYEKKVGEYAERVEKFNNLVRRLEKNNEMTKEVFEELKDEQEELAEIKEGLDDERRRVNNLAQKVNEVVNKESTLIEDYNSKVGTYRDIFGESMEFNQGEYDGMTINIYQFHSDNDLVLVLSHELGHALGIGHVEDSQSIMYYLMENQDLENIKLTRDDLAAIEKICKIE